MLLLLVPAALAAPVAAEVAVAPDAVAPDAAAPDAADVERLVRDAALADDPVARARALQELEIWTFRASWGPLPADAPLPFGPGWLTARAADRDPRVRRAVAGLARDLRADPSPGEVDAVLRDLADDPEPSVRRAALSALSPAARDRYVAAEDAWGRALAAVPEPGAPGRAASSTLARLAADLDAGGPIDPAAAIELVLRHHPELAWRVWAAWRADVPFDRDRFDRLMTSTVGASRACVLAWAKDDPEAFAMALTDWRARETGSERWRALTEWLADADPRVRTALSGS